jgi:hypothetical protein
MLLEKCIFLTPGFAVVKANLIKRKNGVMPSR